MDRDQGQGRAISTQHTASACYAVAIILTATACRCRSWEIEVKNYQHTLVFVIGGSEGIGKAIATAFLTHGAHVLIFSRSPDKLHAALTELEALRTHAHQTLLAHPLDVTEERQTDAVMQP